MKDLFRCEKVIIFNLRSTNESEQNFKKCTSSSTCLFSVISLCKKKLGTGQLQGDVYTGTDTVEYLASGVPDRVFFATNESVLTTKSRETLRKQAAWLRKNSKINIVVEGHADERGTREYNLALGERRANAAKDYLMTYGISADRISVISYGKERPAFWVQIHYLGLKIEDQLQ